MSGGVPTKAGQPCRVIDGRMRVNGEGQSSNIGRIVETVYLHSTRAGTPENSFAVWKCKATDGLPLSTYYGAGPEADFLAIWLEVIETPEPPPIATTTDREITA